MRYKNKSITIISIAVLSFFVISTGGFAKAPINKITSQSKSSTVDNSTYINANQILMFVTNHGNFGRDLSGTFGYDYGTWYPYTGNISDYSNHTIFGDYSPLYSAGLWIGGKVNNQVRVSVSEYSSEFTPGPMTNGTYIPDHPDFKVYKLYADSLQSNPNADYLNWPVNQGAPVDDLGQPVMRGDQMLWSVYNDANQSKHTNMATNALGLEIQQTVWATNDLALDTIPNESQIIPTATGSQKIFTEIIIVDAKLLTGDEYEITTNSETFNGDGSWSLFNVTTNQLLVDNFALDINNPLSQVIDGFQIKFIFDNKRIESIEVVANANGVVDPPVSAAMWSQGFPTPDNTDPGSAQQAGDGKWAFHTGDNGGTSGGGTRGDYESFITRVFRGDPGRVELFRQSDWEMRFTGSNDNPGVNGGYALSTYTTEKAYWVPFELWMTGQNTPDDPSDDIRLIPWIVGDGGDSLYYLSSYGSDVLGNCGPHEFQGCDHSASEGDDDPYTDWIYWRIPADASGNMAEPGEAGYMVFENAAIADPSMAGWPYNEIEVFGRTVLVNIDAGVQPPFNQELPEQGTVLRIRSKRHLDIDTNRFVSNAPNIITGSGDATSVYMMYKLTNKGGNRIDSCYISYWSDPDLGSLSDDLTGCDTLSNSWFCYNSSNNDSKYGYTPPALGFKLLYGPIVKSINDSAYYSGKFLQGYKNLPMTSFSKYFNGTDPDGPSEAYNYMSAKTVDGNPFYYNGKILNYQVSGDPTTGSGDVDSNPSDRRMMASSGPFTFMPYSTQFIFLKMTLGQGADNLNSITRVKDLLNLPFDLSNEYSPCCVGYRGNTNSGFDDGTIENSIDISDVIYLVAYMFHGGNEPACMEEADINGSGGDPAVDIADLVALIEFMFRGYGPPAECF